MTNTLNKIMHNGTEYDFPEGFTPGNTGTTGDVLKKTASGYEWDTEASSNTKTFYLSSTSDTTTAQAAYDWYVAGKNPIVVLSNIVYVLGDTPTSTSIKFYSHYEGNSGNSDTTLSAEYVKFTLSSGTVTAVGKYTGEQVRVLATNVTGYLTPYTPTSDGHPATKKYVDDKHSAITVTLASASWSSKSITVSATGVTASNTVIVSPAPSDFSDYTDAVIYCSAQGSGTLTFSCDTEPTNDIDVNVVILN